MNHPQRIVLDTNCLLMSIPSKSPYHSILLSFLKGEYILCVTNEILLEYEEIITNKTNSIIAANIINAILSSNHTQYIHPVYRFRLIEKDVDDNKFVDCAIHANAKYIVTQDQHFEVLKSIGFPHIDVIDIDTFSYLLATGRHSQDE